MVYLFAYMLLHPDDVVSRYFELSFLLNGIYGPWLPNQYTSSFAGDDPVRGYEALIGTADSGKTPSTLEFVRLPTLSISPSPAGVSVLWNVFYTNFVLPGIHRFAPGKLDKCATTTTKVWRNEQRIAALFRGSAVLSP